MALPAEEFIALAKEAGFTSAGLLDPATIELKEEVRAMCAEGKCHAYGHNWTCPPACGSLEKCRAEVANFKAGIIVQFISGPVMGGYTSAAAIVIGLSQLKFF